MRLVVTGNRFSNVPRQAATETGPLGEMNTTPLIDVMLVLLIMFIITIPTQTHRIALDLPSEKPIPPDLIRPLRNDLAMNGGGALRWNGRAIDDRELAALLNAVANRDKQPEVHFTPASDSRYERVDEVLGIAARSGATSFGFAGNERFEGSF